MKRKIGDKVKLKTNLIVGNTYGGITYTKTVDSFYKGMQTTILKVNPNHYILKDFKNWGFSDDMLEDVSNFKWKFNILEFKNNNIAIHCKTQEESEKLFKLFINNGFKWSDGEHIDISNTYYNDYEEKTCYEFYMDCDYGIGFADLDYYKKIEYIIYKFSEIDFSEVLHKEDIDNKLYCDQNEFDIFKAKYITKEQLSNRGYKTGDILFDGESMAIVYGKKVLHINDNCVETLNSKAFNRILPIELIENDSEIQRLLSGKLSRKIQQAYLEDCFIKIEEPPKLKTICTVKFTADTLATKGFILEETNGNVKEGDIIECCTSGNAYQYCRVVRIEQLKLSEHEINNYRTCRKLSL